MAPGQTGAVEERQAEVAVVDDRGDLAIHHDPVREVVVREVVEFAARMLEGRFYGDGVAEVVVLEHTDLSLPAGVDRIRVIHDHCTTEDDQSHAGQRTY